MLTCSALDALPAHLAVQGRLAGRYRFPGATAAHAPARHLFLSPALLLPMLHRTDQYKPTLIRSHATHAFTR